MSHLYALLHEGLVHWGEAWPREGKELQLTVLMKFWQEAVGKHSFRKGCTLFVSVYFVRQDLDMEPAKTGFKYAILLSTCQELGFQVCMVTICVLASLMLPVVLSYSWFPMQSLFSLLTLFYITCWERSGGMPGNAYRCQRTPYRDHFSPATCVLGIELFWSGFAASHLAGPIWLLKQCLIYLQQISNLLYS